MRKWLYDRVEANVCDKAAFLNLCARSHIPLGDTENVDECRLRFSLRRGDMEAAEQLAARCGGSLRVLRTGLWQRTEERARYHRLLLLPAALLGAGLLLSSLFLWELDFADCPASVERWQVMGALDRAGLRPGCFVPTLHTELICSRALESLPELASLSVNIRGSRASVEATERVKSPEVRAEKGKSELIAERQALLTDVRVLSGTALVNRGMAVDAGDVLIRPSSTSPRARGEVMGLCRLEKTALLPQSAGESVTSGKKQTQWALRWGKRCIFLQTDSSISSMVCGKIYSASKGALPIGICKLTRSSVECAGAQKLCPERYAETLLEQLVAKELGREGELHTAVLTQSGEALTVRCECELPTGAERAIE